MTRDLKRHAATTTGPTGAEPRLPQPARQWALFLDIDGTLLDIACTPDRVAVPAGLPALLRDLHAALDGAVALVSGRGLADIDRLFGRLPLAIAAAHGGIVRDGAGVILTASAVGDLLEPARAAFAEFCRAWPGCRVDDDKGASLALHYRGNPLAGPAALALAKECYHRAGGAGLRILTGKMVVELAASGTDKGTAVERLMARPPFRGRRPVFVGDDVTDQDGFAVARRLGGHAVQVGEGPDGAAGDLAAPAAVRTWLADVLAQLGRERKATQPS